MKPVIGVMSSYNPEKRTFVVRANYLSMIRDAGGMPVVLPICTEVDEMEALLDGIDGLLLTGGDDVEPARYGEETLPCCGEITYERDAFEIEMIPRAVNRDIPVFGICRGIQVLNVALGGSLYQDLPTQVAPGASAHEQPEPYDAPTHSIRLAEGLPLAALWRTDSMMVNSMHHQGIKRLADCLEPMAWAPEGFIEAVNMPGRRYVRAVQWHPEYMCEPHVCAGVRQPQLDMLRQFVAAAADAKTGSKSVGDKA
jgi:putative glutamine amidotransferase